MDAPKYRAFISYSHRDSRWASWLHGSLEKYRPPKPLIGTVTARGEVPRRLVPIFRDRDELASATDLGTLINAALEGSACQIVICSPPAAKSKWVNEEILAFKRLGREDRIFCLIVDGEPNASDMPGREDEECFPPALRFCLGADGALSTTRTEPIAADARPGKDGKQNAKLKLIAGLLGVGFDALKRREQQRRNRRLFAFSCAAMGGMVLTSGLAAYALIQRNVARQQTVRAEAEAETAKQTTKFLVDLFKVSDPSEARGNAVTAREMLDKGAARIDTELAKQPAIQATLMDTLGTVYMGLGLYSQARPFFERAVATRRRLADVDPLDVSGLLSREGYLLTEQADYAAGENAYREAIRIESARSDRRSQEQLATSLWGFGNLLRMAQRNSEAAASLRAALALQHTLYGDAHPDIARTTKDLAWAVAKMDGPKAGIPLMRSAIDMLRQLRGDAPDPTLAEAIGELAEFYWEQGDLDNAEKYYRETLAMDQRLYGEKHPDIATSLEMLANVIADKGNLAGSVPLFRRSIAMRRDLLGDEHPDLARTMGSLASVQHDLGDAEGAFASLRQALAIYRKVLPADDPKIAFATNKLGFWLMLAGNYAEAERNIDDALAMRRRLFDERNPEVAQSLLVVAYLKIAEGKYAEALGPARAAKSSYATALSPDHWRTAAAESAEGASLTGLGRLKEADALLVHSVAILSKDGPPLSYRGLATHYLDLLHARERQRGARSASDPAPSTGDRKPVASLQKTTSGDITSRDSGASMPVTKMPLACASVGRSMLGNTLTSIEGNARIDAT